ncbi:MAG: hypothetical protein ACRDP1_00475 [Nocardioidaceae bacterium]
MAPPDQAVLGRVDARTPNHVGLSRAWYDEPEPAYQETGSVTRC